MCTFCLLSLDWLELCRDFSRVLTSVCVCLCAYQQGNESLVAKTTVTVPNNGGPIETVTTVEAVPYWTRRRRKTGKF